MDEEFCPRSITFTIPAKLGLGVQVTVVENGGDLDFTVDVLETTKHAADLRGLFFDLVDDADLGTLKILGGDGLITGTQIKADGVINLGQGVNMNGAADPFDIGIAFGTPGKGKDFVTDPVHFTLNAVQDLTLDDIAHVLFGARLTNVGDKITFLAPAAPKANDDYFSIFEDGAAGLSSPSKSPTHVVLDVAANDTDADGDTLIVTDFHIDPLQPIHGTVAVSDDLHSILYTPDLDFSGEVSFDYCVSDGNGGQDSAHVTIDVTPVADTPAISVEALPGANVYEIILNVTASQNDADSSEFIDRIEASVAGGLPPGVTITPLGVFNPGDEPDQIAQQFIVTLPHKTDVDFDLTLTAVSQETGNGDQEIATTTVPIVLDYNSNVFDRTFEATDRSIWDNDAAIGFKDADFFGPNIVFNDDPEVTVPIPVPGTPVFVDATADIDGHFKVGFNYDIEINGGKINAHAPIEVTLDTTYNKTSDVLQIDGFSQTLQGLHFDTDGPGGHFNLDALADIDLTFDLNLALESLFDYHVLPDSIDHLAAHGTVPIIEISDQSNISLPLPLGITATAAFPADIDVTGNSGADLNVASGTDGSNDFIQIDWNIGEAASEIVPLIAPLFAPLPVVVPPLVGTVTPIIAEIGVGANLIQNFVLTMQGMSFDVLLEDNTPYHLDPINGVQIDHALSHDLNGDGLVEFTLIMDPGAQLKNDTEIGINFDWNLDLIRADLTVPLPVGDLVDLLNDVFDFFFGDDDVIPTEIGIHQALVDLGQSDIPVTEIDVLERTFSLDFQSQNAMFAA